MILIGYSGIIIMKMDSSTKLLGQIKNVNYEVDNIDKYKQGNNNELFGAFGYLAELNLYKQNNNLSRSFLTLKSFIKIRTRRNEKRRRWNTTYD